MVLLVFDPRGTWARLYDYDPDGRQVGIALCAEHGDAVSVPAGWEIVDDRSPIPHLAPVAAPAADAEPPDPPGTGEPATAQTVSGSTVSGSTATGSPTLWSVDETAPGDPDDEGDEDPDADQVSGVDGIPDDDRLGDRDAGDDLDVDESTPLLSRAFRAAHVD